MPDLFNLSKEMKQYYNSLPKSLQETIIQSGAKINSLTDLKAVAQGFVGENITNPTVQPSNKTEMGVPIPSTQNIIDSKQYEEENEL